MRNCLATPSTPIRQSVQLEPGINRISVAVHIANPKLWYPLGVGAQDRYRFSAAGADRAQRGCGCVTENRPALD